jgi:hypothetical protein
MAHRRKRATAAAADAPFKGDESGAMRWLLFPGVRRQCRQCGKEPLRIQDVGEHRKLYPSRKTEFLCRECQGRNVQRMVEKERRALGLQEREASEGF